MLWGRFVGCLFVFFFSRSQLLYSFVLTTQGLIKGDFSGQATDVSSDSVMFNSVFPAPRLQGRRQGQWEQGSVQEAKGGRPHGDRRGGEDKVGTVRPS